MKKDRSKELFLDQLRRVPNITFSCEKVGISRAIVYVWQKKDEAFSKELDQALAEGVAMVNDLAVSVLLQRIKNGELPPSIFWLKNRHPDFKNKIEVDATIRAQREELTSEQEEAVKKALVLAGLLEEPSSTGQSNGSDEKKETPSQNKHE